MQNQSPNHKQRALLSQERQLKGWCPTCPTEIKQGLGWLAAISTVGSCSCYGVSKLLGSQLAGAIWPERLASFQSEVEKQRGNIFNYILFLRLTPILPNTFINMASPIVHVPLSTFMLGTSAYDLIQSFPTIPTLQFPPDAVHKCRIIL